MKRVLRMGVALAAAGTAVLVMPARKARLVGTSPSHADAVRAHSIADERDVFVAALAAEARFLTKGTAPAGQPVICVALDPGDAPQSATAEVVQRLSGTAARLVRGAECEVRPRLTVELATGARAILLTAGPVDWTADDEALVTVRQTKKRGETIQKQYRVVRENERWIALGPVWKMSPV